MVLRKLSRLLAPEVFNELESLRSHNEQLVVIQRYSDVEKTKLYEANQLLTRRHAESKRLLADMISGFEDIFEEQFISQRGALPPVEQIEFPETAEIDDEDDDWRT